MEFSWPLSSLFKRKTRGSNSPTSENISPETKRLKESVKEDQANAPPAIVSPTKSKNDSEDVVLSALNMAQDFASKVDLILSKLSQLENIGTQINVLQDSVDRINQTVANLQSEFHRLKEDVRNTVEETNTLKTSVKFLNDEVETSKRKLRDDEEKSRQELDHLRLQLLNYEVYSRRENLRFYGIPEIEGEENTEPVLKAFLEKELNVENAQVHRVGKKDRNTRKPRAIIARCLRFKVSVNENFNRENLFSCRRNIDSQSNFGIGPDLPKQVIDMRKRLIPKMVQARKDGKRAAFSRTEPYKLFIDGVEVKS
ncbi:unnamed protein product [Porites lobata]|uniref:Uncharacterized protein n=1 Tax=Porites lobata TaxID=104759 RepID=A0ABN8RZ28_9CNID|nr:unnamed protein product [Porites lobata]